MQKIDEENLNLKMEVILNPENQNVIIPAKEVEKSNDISDLKSKLNSLFESYHDCISRSQSINKDKEKRKEIETKILNYMNELDIDSIILSSKYMLKKSKAILTNNITTSNISTKAKENEAKKQNFYNKTNLSSQLV